MIELSGMVIEVKASDIREAKRIRKEFDERKATSYARGESCPLAIALRRVFPNYSFFIPGLWIGISWAKDGRPHKYMGSFSLSPAVQKFINHTDKVKDQIRARTIQL